MSGDVAGTEALYDELVERTGKIQFDSFKHRVSHCSNYLILASGYADGYAAAERRLDELRALGQRDTLSYSYLMDIANQAARGLGGDHGGGGGGGGGGGRSAREQLRVERMLQIWERLEADGVAPSANVCHKMFGVWAASGNLERAEATFSHMRQSTAGSRAPAAGSPSCGRPPTSPPSPSICATRRWCSSRTSHTFVPHDCGVRRLRALRKSTGAPG